MSIPILIDLEKDKIIDLLVRGKCYDFLAGNEAFAKSVVHRLQVQKRWRVWGACAAIVTVLLTISSLCCPFVVVFTILGILLLLEY